MYKLIDLDVKDFKMIQKRVPVEAEVLYPELMVEEENEGEGKKKFVLEVDLIATKQLLSAILRALPAGQGKLALMGKNYTGQKNLLHVLTFKEDIQREIRSVELNGKSLLYSLSKLLKENKLKSISFKILSKK